MVTVELRLESPVWAWSGWSPIESPVWGGGLGKVQG